jgi:hypothetical protein
MKSLILFTAAFSLAAPAYAKYDGCGGKAGGENLQLANDMREVEKKFKKICGKDGDAFEKLAKQADPYAQACDKVDTGGGSFASSLRRFSKVADECKKLKEEFDNVDSQICKVRANAAAKAQAGAKKSGSESKYHGDMASMYQGLKQDHQLMKNSAQGIEGRLAKMKESLDQQKSALGDMKARAGRISSQSSPQYQAMLNAARQGGASAVDKKRLRDFETNIAQCRMLRDKGPAVAAMEKRLDAFKDLKDRTLTNLTAAEANFNRQEAQSAALEQESAARQKAQANAEARGGAAAGGGIVNETRTEKTWFGLGPNRQVPTGRQIANDPNAVK